jgi:hypothetical protein
MRRLMIALLTFVLFAAACGGGDEAETATEPDTGSDDVATDETDTTDDEAVVEDEPAAPAAVVHRVPEDFATIQAAVDAAAPGEMVLIGEGVYNESVVVETENLVIRGVDRNKVILDGEHSEEMANGIIVFANGVAVENLTVRNYSSNGLFFTGDYDSDFVLHGYRASYITAHNNRKYGIYAFNAEYGVIEHSYASGQTDSGYYVGQCQPCNAVLHNNISEANTLGYSGTNAGGNLYIVNNEFRNNRAGIVPNTLDSEELAPQRTAVFAGNWVHGTGNPETPASDNALWELMFGIGIVLPGANDNLVTRNIIESSASAGIAISWLPDENTWTAERNEVRGNVFRNNPTDAVLVVLEGTDPLGNCFSDNELSSSVPADIQTVAPCDGAAAVITDFAPITFVSPPADDANLDYTLVAAPGDQPNMPNALTAEPSPANVLSAFDSFDLDAIELPTGA